LSLSRPTAGSTLHIYMNTSAKRPSVLWNKVGINLGISLRKDGGIMFII